MKTARIYRGAAMASIALCLASAAGAQTSSGDAVVDTTGEIIVTAQKRSESVQKIPLAVSAIGGDALQQRGATTLTALGQTVPGLNVSEQVGQARLTLRGIGVDNISTGAESSVAFNQDGIFYSRSAAALASFYDVERVEVLRGPQGTLYGRNATGGSVNILTNRPDDGFGAGANLTVGNRETINADAFVNTPLSETVSARLSGQVQHHNGYGKNLVTGTDIDTKSSQAVRAQLLFTPDDRLTILIGGDYYRSRDRSNTYHYFGAGGVTAAGAPITPTSILLGGFAPASKRDIASAQDPRARADFYGGRIDISYDLSDSMTLRSLSAYRRSDYQVESDISPLAIDLFPVTVTEKSDQFTQEFQLNIDSDSNKFVAGLFYLHEKIDGSISAPLNLLSVGGPDFFVQGFYAGGRMKTDAAAIYAQDTYSISDRVRLTLGGRYSWERKSVNDQSDFDFARPYSPTNVPLTPRHIDDESFKSFTPKVGIDVDLGPRALAYASFSKGFKSGTYNLGSAGPPLKPEKVDAYELGVKATSSDGMFRANIAGFYYNYKDLQVGKVQGQLVVLENAATARIYGLEGEFVAKPTPDLTLSANASWLHARFRDYVTADQARPAGDGSTIDPASGLPAFDLSGKTLPQSPDYTVSLAADYVVHLDRGTLTLRGESNWSDRVYFSPFNRKEVSQPSYSLQNAYATYDDGAHWRLSLYIKNIANKTILASGQVATALLGSPIVGFVQPPRTFGATLGYRF
ncbi:MAG: TonB-dependent receptor [Sphingobium sp.]|uniref:TonB-dependent receptor n=1 Tax=Sphingobium sp. TaxID=1912891 RepID=UPI002E1BD18B